LTLPILFGSKGIMRQDAFQALINFAVTRL
jgi:hypothetical protein